MVLHVTRTKSCSIAQLQVSSLFALMVRCVGSSYPGLVVFAAQDNAKFIKLSKSIIT